MPVDFITSRSKCKNTFLREQNSSIIKHECRFLEYGGDLPVKVTYYYDDVMDHYDLILYNEDGEKIGMEEYNANGDLIEKAEQ